MVQGLASHTVHGLQDTDAKELSLMSNLSKYLRPVGLGV